jgi:hypothetical protein
MDTQSNPPGKPPVPPSGKPTPSIMSKWVMAQLAFDMGFVIAVPLVALGLLGKYLDGRLETKPWLTLAGIFLAIVISTFWLGKKIKGYMKRP